MHKEFDIASVLADVSKLGTQQPAKEQIVMIPLELIDDDPANFYTLSQIDDLAENIELFGLMDPVRLRPNPEKSGYYIIVSGHRRRAACQKLASEGNQDYASIPSIVDESAGSEALRELRLIYANSSTRDLTSAEISQQARRVEALLYQLKEEGYDFPGRMRDHVAEACKISKSKLSRLKAIDNNLSEAWKQLYREDKLNESTAYALSQLPPERQNIIYNTKCGNGERPHIYEGQVSCYTKRFDAIEKIKCRKKGGGECSNRYEMYHKSVTEDTWRNDPCEKCCDKCENLTHCKYACPMLAEKVKKLKADAKEAKRQEDLAKQELERPIIEQIQNLWYRFGVARAKAGKSVKECCDVASKYYGTDTVKEFMERESRSEKSTTHTSLPYYYRIDRETVTAMCNMADLLGCSIDYLFCRTDNPALNTGAASATAWSTGTPEKPMDVLAAVRIDGVQNPLFQKLHWDGADWIFSGKLLDPSCSKVALWTPVPEVPNV